MASKSCCSVLCFVFFLSCFRKFCFYGLLVVKMLFANISEEEEKEKEKKKEKKYTYNKYKTTHIENLFLKMIYFKTEMSQLHSSPHIAQQNDETYRVQGCKETLLTSPHTLCLAL